MKKFEKDELKYENKMAERYNDDYHSSIMMKKHDKEFVEYVNNLVVKNDRVLDLGCGPASLWNLWDEELTRVQKMVGMDLSDEMISIAKKKWPQYEFYVGSLFSLPFVNGEFDVIIVSSVLHHIPDKNLDNVFKEIYRVLDEHGTVVGREPVGINRLADEPGWFSGAIMSFRHLIYRLTNTREYPEPNIGEHHHAYDPKIFFKILSNYFATKGIEFKYPFSSYVNRCENEIVFNIVESIDQLLKHKKGQEFYYSAQKNYNDINDIAQYIEKSINENNNIDNLTEVKIYISEAAKAINMIIKNK